MMKRLVSWLFFIGLAVGVAAVVLPGFIDWTRHKDVLVNEISSRLGQEVRIDGDVALRLLPNPHIRLENVHIGNAEKDKYLVALGALDARMSLDDLLQGRFVVDSIHLQEPVINIAIDRTGSNWAAFWAARTAETAGGGQMVALNQVTLSHARIAYHNATTGQRWDIPRLNMILSADSLAGPYRARGDVLYDEDAPLTFVLETAARKPDGAIPFTIDAQPIEDFPTVKAEGMFNPVAPDVVLSARISARDGKAVDLLRPFNATGTISTSLPALTVAAETEMTLEVGHDVAFKNIKVSGTDGSSLAGDVTYRAQDLRLESDVTLTKPDAYWLSFKGNSDVVRRVHAGEAYIKLQNLAGFVPFAPDLSVEAQGTLSYAGAESWALEDATFTVPDWQQEWQGRIQRVGGQAAAFALTAPRVGVLADVSANGQFAQTLQVDGTATVFGHALPFSLAGAPDKPDVKIDLSVAAPQDVLAALGAAGKGVTLEGGATAFAGKLDLQAQSLATALSGRLDVTPQKIKLASFAPAALEQKIHTLTTVPDDLGAQMLAAVTSADSVYTAKPVSFTLPLAGTPEWRMTGLAYDGGTVAVTTQGTATRIAVTAGDKGVLSYKGALSLDEKDMPQDQAKESILLRHPPVPEVDTKAAIGDILNRLDGADDAAAAEPVAAPVEGEMPPQPQPALPEKEIAPPPPLPDDTPLAVGNMDEAAPVQEDDIPDEIFPVENLPE